MKKIYLFLLLSIITAIAPALAGVTEMNNIEELRTKRSTTKEIKLQNVQNLETVSDYRKFFAERLKTVEIALFDEDEDLTSMNSMNIQHSQEYIEQMEKENEKGALEKIYDAALSRLGAKENNTGDDIAQGSGTVFYREINQRAKETVDAPDIPTVEVILPGGDKILAPAAEHIPYLFVNAEILPTGLIKITETVVVIANGQKLRNGLTKMLPKYSISRDGTKHKIDYDLQEVSINNRQVEHKFVEIGNNLLLKAKENYILSPGVYTYRFSYILDRHLWEYDDFKEFYWNVTGSKWNLLITRAVASINFPGEKPSISQNVLIGFGNDVSPERARMMKRDENTLIFFSSTPVLIGENMHVLIALPKEDFIAPDMNKRFSWFIEDYGDNLFALLGFAAILLSYILSWHYIKTEKSKSKQGLKKNPAVMRYLLNNKFDNISFGSFILDLYRKNVIDIEKGENDEVILIKKTDNLKPFSRREKSVINNLFLHGDSILRINKHSLLKLRRAYKIYEKETKTKMRIMYMQMNFSYMMFSVAMMLIAQVAMAINSVNFAQTMLILLSSDVVFAFYVWIAKSSFKNKLLAIILKSFAIIFIAFTLLVLSVYILTFAALLILAMIITIFAYSDIFSKRNGLVRSKIKEVVKYRGYLENNVKNISLGREFLLSQPSIYALNLAKVYEGYREKDNKMPLMDIMMEIIA